MKRLVLSIAAALAMALLLGAREPAHGYAAAALSSISEGASTVCDDASATGASLNQAALIVAFEEGRTEAFCVEFSEDEISGAELLERSGLEVVFSSGGGFGAGVCRIEGTGCNDPTDCFCQCRGSSCAYWSYWTRQDAKWRYQQFGASQREVRDGDIDAWVWGNGRSAPSNDGGICPTVTPSPPQTRPTPTMVPRPASRGSATTLPPDWPINAPTNATAQRPNEGGTTPVALLTTTAETALRPTAAAATATLRTRADTAPEDDSSDDGAPMGIIAFSVVAGTLVLAIGGIAVQRRFSG